MKNNNKRRVSVVRDTHQSEYSLEDDEETRFRARQKVLFQDFLNLEQEFVSKKKQLAFAKERRQTLLHEVEFLRRRHAHLMKMQSDEQEEQDQRVKSVQAGVDVKRKSANGSLDRGKKKKKNKTDKHTDFSARYELSLE